MLPTEIWTPPAKISDRVRNIAFSLFMERWKVTCSNNAQMTTEELSAAYRACIAHAKTIVEVENQGDR